MDMWGVYRMLVSIQSAEALTMTFHHSTEQVAIKFQFKGEIPVAYIRSYTGDLAGARSNYFCVANHWPQDCYTQWVEPEHISNFLQEVKADPSWVEATTN